MKLDLQTHTHHSPACGWLSPRSLVETAAARGLDGVAITDHNTTAGWAAARRHAPSGFHVIPGEEVDTTGGQVIGLFVEARIEPGRGVAETIGAIHDQGGLAVAPHPYDRFRSGLGDLARYAEGIDAVEVLNARCLLPRDNRRAAAFAAESGLPALGGSDGHFAGEVGSAYTVVEVADGADDPRESIAEAILAGRTRPAGSGSTPLYHAGTALVKAYNRIGRSRRPAPP